MVLGLRVWIKVDIGKGLSFGGLGKFWCVRKGVGVGVEWGLWIESFWK